jgi:hypothetical protein
MKVTVQLIKCSHKIPEFISQKLGKELERCSEYYFAILLYDILKISYGC